MKRIILLLSLFSLLLPAAFAQSQYITLQKKGNKDQVNSQLNGKGGVLVLSRIPDLVITIVQESNTPVERSLDKNAEGYYEYRLVVDNTQLTQVKLMVAKRGDVNSTSETLNLTPNRLCAVLVDEVKQPIMLEDQSAVNDPDKKLDASLALVEIASTISTLQVKYSDALGATFVRERRANDASVTVYKLSVPLANLKAARKQFEQLFEQCKALNDQLIAQGGSEAAWAQLEQLEHQRDKKSEELEQMCKISVSAESTNELTIDISDIKAKNKYSYGVLLLNKEVEVTNCNRWMREGGNLFAQTKYEEAKRAYQQALDSKDKSTDVVPVIQANIAQCDSCILYSNMVNFAFKRIAALKEQSTVSQSEVAEYYGAASDCMSMLYRYNPIADYKALKDKLDKFVENLPLALKIYTVGWQVTRVGANETGPMDNVEVWTYTGTDQPRKRDYRSDDDFAKLVKKSDDYQRLGVTNAAGVLDVELLRRSLPNGFFFRPLGKKRGKTQVEYLDMQYVLSKAKGEYTKRQFRMKIYTEK